MRPLSKTGNYISTRIGRAIADYDLIKDKDRILVAVSGGKDSLTMLELLNERKKWAPIDYDLIAMHIETDHRCGGCIHTKILKKFFEDRGIEYVFKKIKVLDKNKKTSCFWCSWNRRKALFLAADRLGCTKIALGHHKDDIIETLLLNIFYHGEFAAMNPRQELFGGKIVLIRPLCYVEEGAMKKFAKESVFPSQICRCPNADTSKRRMVKNLIRDLEKGCPQIRTNIFRSVSRVKKGYIRIKDPDIKELEEEVKIMAKGGDINGRESRKGRYSEEEGLSLLRR
ncbi:MAG: tRNA 2-thiocytidine(32) synthetase TtcA [Candidatus Omnitrophica bacterium]|nr:tRNA 2-thiocytidine(32) synthetase TtcA [Candidatus Omnitrophota bacterium]